METPIAQITRRYPASERGDGDGEDDGTNGVYHERKENEGKGLTLSRMVSRPLILCRSVRNRGLYRAPSELRLKGVPEEQKVERKRGDLTAH